MTSTAIRGELLKPQEVAKFLKVSVNTVYHMVTYSEIPAHYIRGSIRFDSADVDDYLFFSKFSGGYLKLSNVDKEHILNRIEDQIYHLRKYIERFINKSKKLSKENVNCNDI